VSLAKMFTGADPGNVLDHAGSKLEQRPEPGSPPLVLCVEVAVALV